MGNQSNTDRDEQKKQGNKPGARNSGDNESRSSDDVSNDPMNKRSAATGGTRNRGNEEGTATDRGTFEDDSDIERTTGPRDRH